MDRVTHTRAAQALAIAGSMAAGILGAAVVIAACLAVLAVSRLVIAVLENPGLACVSVLGVVVVLRLSGSI